MLSLAKWIAGLSVFIPLDDGVAQNLTGDGRASFIAGTVNACPSAGPLKTERPRPCTLS
jgi:hypothetical protein